MQVKFGSLDRLKKHIDALLREPEMRVVAIVFAAIYFEWALRRFILVFGRDSTSEIRTQLKDQRGGYSGYEVVFNHQLYSPVKRGPKGGFLTGSENKPIFVDPAEWDSLFKLKGWNQAYRLEIKDVVKNWNSLSRRGDRDKDPESPVDFRNAIAHGSLHWVTFPQAKKTIKAYLKGISDLEKFCNDHYESLFKQIRRRKPWGPNEKLQKEIDFIRSTNEQLSAPAYAKHQRKRIPLPDSVHREEIDLISHRSKRKAFLARRKLCKPYLTT